ncbi:hypothetical protein BGZ96_011386 [Linnemannia gamsii]|uniref:Uncharacterized protein n=1 Tax=Linnemannia gamsii TaxID=64522 RepID=A0ABQ7JSH2_9FUNG|nr:hypothetical protein BGZ96_011386 [Linnemannia gamsii]
MALKRSSLVFLASALVAFITHGPVFQAEAAPIDRLLALIPSSPTHRSQQLNDDSAPLQQPPQPSLGRAQIRPIGQRHPLFPSRPSDRSAEPSFSSSQIPSSDSSASPLSPAQQQPQAPPSETWSDRTLGGHAVVDDDDDDAGNELLDTEADGLLRPDADDEIEGTIEGEVLEEEEYGNESEIEYDDGEDDDSSDGDIYEPWLTMPLPSTSSRLTHREARRTRLARLTGGEGL